MHHAAAGPWGIELGLEQQAWLYPIRHSHPSSIGLDGASLSPQPWAVEPMTLVLMPSPTCSSTVERRIS